MREPELWRRKRGSSESLYIWMVFRDVKDVRWYEKKSEALIGYDTAREEWRAEATASPRSGTDS